MIRITKIRVHYHLKIPKGTREAADRALATHKVKCPAAMSVEGAIEISLSHEIEEE